MEKKILSLLNENYALGLEEQLSLDTPLLELNILDSSTFFDLIEIIQAEFGVTVPLTEIKPDNFASARAIVRMTNDLLAPSAAA
ncbi:phosphopantetheine-binding protein [Notoacmeibacter sp. MSK16QG-6]|uniref:phosphopantetheine-binding protein n=1 Tax=Notoacmeibacter sp. MSK16QG-6 TaxID=2957982 RepID=UPI0020A08A56|nr:phosphopantetheine-binding protein [Notoacmeibacter sp. MSK16QG-6]MCP1200481.1 phosphopantetheine-binding protein [Notoacmeibacter sp. MSK16QG-6]